MNAIYVAKVSKNSCVYCSQLKLTVIHFKFKDYNKEKSLTHYSGKLQVLSDLLYQDIPTTNPVGEVREASFSSQMEYVDESLGYLFQEMKKGSDRANADPCSAKL